MKLEVDYRSLEDIKKLVERKADDLDGVMLDAGGVIIGLYFAIAIDLPSVTPQPRKGHWVLTDVEGYRVWHCNCSECGKDPQDYVGGSEDWWLIKSQLPKYCPNCGSRNEVEE